jgi:protein-S-isoprenylcysteine O-methyltransferase Ste14
MKGSAWGIIAVGALLAIIGAAFAITEQNAADSMSLIERLLSPDVYDNHIQNAEMGWIVAAIGLIIAVVGLIVGAVSGGKKPA